MLVPSKSSRRLFLAGVGFVCSLVRCGAAPAQDVGTVVALRGPVEIGRGGAWMPAVNGMPVQLGDEVRTGAGGRVSLTFQDGTVLSAADQSRVVIDQQVFGGTGGPSHGMFRLLQGLVRSVVTAYYAQNLGSLVEAVNKLGSLFYGSMLGVFALAFFFPKVRGTAAFIAVLAGEAVVFTVWNLTTMAFLWYNVIGCLVVIVTGVLITSVTPIHPSKSAPAA